MDHARPQRRRSTMVIVLLALGSLAGVWAGGVVAHREERRAGEADLDRYAERLLRTGTQLAAETDDARDAVLSDGFPFCSDAELAFMRNWVYNASHVRDIGRTRDGKLFCSTGMGRLHPAPRLGHADLSLDGMRVSASAPLLISRQSLGFITESEGVSLVLNPAAYTNLDEAPMTFGAWLHVPGTSVLLHGFGHRLPLSDAEILANERMEKAGTIYRPLCAEKTMICVAGAEPLTELMAKRFRWTRYFCIAGGLFGGGLVALVLLLRLEFSSMERQLRRAIRRRRLDLEYQPVVDLATGKTTAAEALVRWRDETGQRVSPEIFVRLAEDKGFIRQITRLVIDKTLAELGDMMAAGGVRVTVNIAAQDLDDPTFDAFLAGCLRKANVPAKALGLELTERSTAGHETAIAAIARLSAAGHSVYIDDFGTGYSSLSYLHQFAVEAIKMDRAFTQTIGTEAVTASVVPQILAMARELALVVVAEGVETPEQAAYLAGSGVRILGQGWFFGKPMIAGALRRRLAAEQG